MVTTSFQASHGRFAKRGVRLLVGLMLLVFGSGCEAKKAPATLEAQAVPAVPTPPKVTEERTDLFYRFKDPKSGAFKTSNAIGEIPASALQEVVVYDPTNDVAGWFFVADLRTPGPNGEFPCEARPAAQMGGRARVMAVAPGVAAGATQKTVRFYTASWCGVCGKARNFLKKEKIPYVEKDVETDPSARGELERAAKHAGVPASQLNGVPIFVIGKEMLNGFDPNRVRQLARQL